MALSPDDVDEDFHRLGARHRRHRHAFLAANTEAAQRKAIRIAKANGGKVVFDIDYRPNLWGLAGHAAGFRALREIGPRVGEAADGAAAIAT